MLDVGPSMHAMLPEVEKVCSMLVQKKVLVLQISFSYHSVSYGTILKLKLTISLAAALPLQSVHIL